MPGHANSALNATTESTLSSSNKTNNPSSFYKSSTISSSSGSNASLVAGKYVPPHLRKRLEKEIEVSKHEPEPTRFSNDPPPAKAPVSSGKWGDIVDAERPLTTSGSVLK